MKVIKLAPSILAADFARLGQQAREAIEGGGDWLHVDVMDGHFVPNISMGPVVVRSLRPVADEVGALLDVHLMITDPGRYVADFAAAGADRLTVHVESTVHLHRTVQSIKELGVKAGVTLNPATPVGALAPILPEVDLVLVMSVNPGYGGQKYISASTGRIGRLRHMLDKIDSAAWLEVDGGIDQTNAAEIVGAGATALVAGSAVFGGSRSIAQNIAAIRAAL